MQLPLPAQRTVMAMLIAFHNSIGVQLAVRHVLEDKHPDIQMQFFDFYQAILDHLVGDRMMARLSGFFGILTAMLVVVGLHGLLSYFVAQRRSKIGFAWRREQAARALRPCCAIPAPCWVAD